MTSTAKWVEGMKSIVDNGRSHSIVIDIPKDQGGEDMGASALECMLMGLSGCITTTFAIIAKKSRYEFESLKTVVDAYKGPKTIEKATVKVFLKADDEEKALKILEKTINVCPVGMIFENAGVEISTELVFD